MIKESFNNIIANPYNLNKDTLDILKDVTSQYPYCQIAHILLAKNIESFDKAEYEHCVNKASVYALNRNKFLEFISDRTKPEKEEVFERRPEKPKKEYKITRSREELEAIVNKRLAEIEEEKKNSGRSNQQNTGKSIFNLENKTREEDNTQADNDKNKFAGIIDKFIREEPTIPVIKKDAGGVDLSESSVEENDDIISETIAELYYCQGNINKAIEVYKKLSLKFTEKSSYFAQRISDIKKETN